MTELTEDSLDQADQDFVDEILEDKMSEQSKPREFCVVRSTKYFDLIEVGEIKSREEPWIDATVRLQERAAKGVKSEKIFLTEHTPKTFAAEEMYEALEDLHSFLTSGDVPGGINAAQRIEHVLAKARGETNKEPK